MNNILIRIGFLLLTVNLSFCKSYTQQKSVGQIALPGNASKELKEAAADMASWLQKASGREFKVVDNGNTATINLSYGSSSNLSSDRLSKVSADGQTFYLFARNIDEVKIIGSGSQSLINGIYTYLHEIGFRWYMPGEAWTIVPDLRSVNISLDKVYSPDFRDRYYAGSGGAAAIPGLDPANEFAADFRTWNRRNRLSTDYPVKGHSGMAFYTSQKKVLDAHPEYFCNNIINKAGRINIANKDAVKIFVDWALSQDRGNKDFPLIGLDPADGSGQKDDCLPSGMSNIKTWSDKYFWLANQVASRLEKNDDKTRVQLYAYSQHADVPGFPLQKNVFPVIIPYSFQYVAEPDPFIKKWRAHMNGRPMGIYDYWNITQWSKCLPQFNMYSIPERLRFWKENNIITINLESTYAKGPMGLPFWIASQMMWDTELDFDKLYSEFLRNCFGNAAPDLKKVFDRWSKHFQDAMEPILSNRDLEAALSKTADPRVKQRITELKAYVLYLQLYYDYNDQPTVANYEKLMNYIYSIHHLRMVHTSALQQYYIPKPKEFIPLTDKNKIEQKNKAVRALSSEEISKNLVNTLRGQPSPYNLPDFEFNIKAAKSETPAEKAIYAQEMISKNNYQFILDKAQEVSFEAGTTENTQLLIKDQAGNILLDKMIQGTPQAYETIRIKLPAGQYVLTYGALYRKSRLKFPKELVFFSPDHNYNNATYPVLYIYVPRGLSEIIYFDQYGPGTNRRGNWIDPYGQVVQPIKVKGTIYKINVPEKLQGKVWAVNMGHRSFRVLNIAENYSLNKFSYTEAASDGK